MDGTQRTGHGPIIPAVLPTDPPEVRDPLSTAHAMLTSGDRPEAVRWLRKAAEAATDLGDDTRALSLFKAASLIGSMRPPPPAPDVGPQSSPPQSSPRCARRALPFRPPASLSAPPLQAGRAPARVRPTRC